MACFQIDAMDTMHNKKLGKEGEDAAAAFLIQHGYRVLHRNMHLGHDELDIIATRNNTLVIVEVKTRATHTFSVPEDYITPHKEHSLIRATERYIEDYDWMGDTRFDLIAIYYAGRKPQIIHIEDAFYPRC